MAAEVARFDWSATELGPVDDWPLPLRTAVGVCLSSRFPMMLVWGVERIMVYNHAYRPMLGALKHPGALGAPISRVWAEVWDDIGPLFEQVTATREPSWFEHMPLMVERNGFVEETYFTFSYGPLFDDGEVRGVLDVAVETTGQVVGSRRIACASLLTGNLLGARQVTDVCARAIEALSLCHVDVPAADVFLEFDGRLSLIASNRRGGDPPYSADQLIAVLEEASRRRSVGRATNCPPSTTLRRSAARSAACAACWC